jgi:hypothetical protein
MRPLIIVTFSWSSDAPVMCFVIALTPSSFVPVSIRHFGWWSRKYIWRRVSNDLELQA